MKRRDYLKIGATVTGGALLPLTSGERASAAPPTETGPNAAGDGPDGIAPAAGRPGAIGPRRR